MAKTIEKEQPGTAAGKVVNVVPVYLIKDGKRYKDDLFVSVNDKTFMIQRGRQVMVPDYVAEVIRNSEAQDQCAMEYISLQEERYQNKKSNL